MTIRATGNGDRNLFVSYISEVPVWKSTYRIVLPKASGTPLLQGWAIIDNTVGEVGRMCHSPLCPARRNRSYRIFHNRTTRDGP
jgi:hypothetical protein